MEIQRQIEAIKGGDKPTIKEPLDPLRTTLLGDKGHKTDQKLLMEQIRTTLAPKEVDSDPNKALLRALITAQNKT